MKNDKRPKKKMRYTPIIEVQNIDENRDLVISKLDEGGYTIAQKAAVEENGKKFSVFLKNAIHVNDIVGLEYIKRALEEAIRIEKENDN